jgi:hypothetical protein
MKADSPTFLHLAHLRQRLCGVLIALVYDAVAGVTGSIMIAVE